MNKNIIAEGTTMGATTHNHKEHTTANAPLFYSAFFESLHKEQWQEVRLGEVAEFGNGKARPKSLGNIPIYGGNGILGYTDKFNYEGETIIIGRVGAYCGCVYCENKQIWVSDNALIAKPKYDNSTKFLYYLLKHMNLNSHAEGSSQPLITQTLLNNLCVRICKNYETQNQIAEILSSFDDKIDLLHRQNKTLESLALTLFRHTFINNPNRNEWEEKLLSEIAKIQNGYAFKNSDYIKQNAETYEVLKMGHIESGGGLRYSPKANYVKINDKITKWVLNEDDIVLAMTDMKDSLGILGYPAMVDKSSYYVLNQRVARIYLKSKDIFLHNYFLFLYLSLQENIQKIQSLANGGVQVNLSTEAIKNFAITIPPLALQNQNNQAFISIITKYKNNRRQIQNLQSMRDMLLQKLLE